MPQPRKLIWKQFQCPGDVLMVTAALRDLMLSQPGVFTVDYQGAHPEIFANNPHITKLDPWDGQIIDLCYGYAIQHCNRPRHFVEGFTEFLSRKLGVFIETTDFRGDIYLSDEEREPWPDLPEHYWLIDAGSKRDFTAKQWSHHRFQQVVDAFQDKLTFVQIGHEADLHPKLNNVISLVGKTSIRELIRVCYRSAGVLTPVSFPMHLAAAVPMPGDAQSVPVLSAHEMHVKVAESRSQRRDSQGKVYDPPSVSPRRGRGCVVIAGHREPAHWESYPGHAYLGANGRISCTSLGAGCWKNKTIKVDNDNSLCMLPSEDEVGQAIPECLRRITVEHVVKAIKSFESM